MPQMPASEVGRPWPADRPLVSVIIPSFNYGRFLTEAVDSVLAQTFTDLEIIVVEGGSTDDESRQIAAALQRPRTRVLFQPSRTQVGANRNLGIAHAQGRYICCLDADDRLKPTYIAKAVFLLERYGYDVVSSALEYFGKRSGIVGIEERPHLASLLQANHVLTCALFPRRWWEAAGGFEDHQPGTKYIFEDWRFWVRLAAYGARFFNMGRDPLLNYRVHGVSLSTGADVAAMADQANRVLEFNGDVLDQEAVRRSSRMAKMQRILAPSPRPQAHARAAQDTDRPTILLAAPFLALGGAERLLSAIVGHLVGQGWRVIVVTTIPIMAFQGDTSAWFERYTADVYHLPNFLPQEAWDDFLRHLVDSREVSLLWVVGSAFAYDRLPTLKAEFPRLKVVDLLFNTVGHTANNRRRSRLIDLNLVENAEVRGWLLDQGESPDRIKQVTSGVDIGALRRPQDTQAVRSQLGLGAEDLLVGFSGRWSEEKNPLAFVEIAHRLDPRLPVHFVMTGAGLMREAIELAIQQSGLAKDRFHLIGEVDDIYPWLAAFDLLVLPSKLDGRPVVVLEALALGTPVLASRVGALPELVTNDLTGWLCEKDDIDGFVRRIRQWAGLGAADREALRDNCRAFADANLNVRDMLNGYESALLEVLSTPPAV